MLHLGLPLLLFLPIVESFNRQLALILLFMAALLISFPVFWQKKIRLDYINLLFLLFIVWGLFTTFFSWSIIRSFSEVARYAAYFLIFVSIRENHEIRRIFTKFLVSLVIINSFLLSLLFIIYSAFKLKSPATLGLNLFYPVFGHNRIDAILIFTIPMLAGLLVFANYPKYKIILRAGIIFFTLMLIWSLGRGAWWALAVTFAIYLLIYPRIRKNLLKMTFYIMLLFLLLTSFIFVFSNFLTTRKEGVNAYLGLYKPVNFEKRTEYYSQAFWGFKDSPILGTGLDTFRYVSKKYQAQPASWSWFAHNHFVQIFTETGMTGGIIFFLLFFILVRKSFEIFKETDSFGFKNVVFISLTPSIIHSFIDYDWQFISILFLVFVGFALITPYEEKARLVNLKPVYLAFLVFIISWLIIYQDSDKILTKSSDTFVLERIYRLDSGYNEISKKLAQVYSNEKQYQKAHDFYRRAILSDPLDSVNEIKADYLLYLREASDKNDYKILAKSKEVYPYFDNKYGQGSINNENLDQYIAQMYNIVKRNPLRVWEIRQIVEFL